MSDSIESLAREVRSYYPATPLALVESWLKDAFRELRRRHQCWSWATGEDQFTFPAAETTGTVTLTNGSSTVTGSGTAFSSSHVGLQFRKQGDPRIFTVTSYTSPTEIELDRTWPAATEAGASFEIYRAYVTVPANFRKFVAIKDPVDENIVLDYKSYEWLNRVDPERDDDGEPLYLVDLRWSSIDNRPMYEVWPHQKTQRDLHFLYEKDWGDYSRTQALPYTIDGDVLKNYALSELCDWPGPDPQTPNPMYSTSRSAKFMARFIQGVEDMIRNDGEIYFRGLLEQYSDYFMGTDWVRSHAVPADYYY